MVSQRKVFSELNKQIKSNKIPSKLTDNERSVLIRLYSKQIYKSFPFTGSSNDNILILNSFIEALKLAEAFSKDLIEPYYYVDSNYGRRARVCINGYAKQTDAYLIQKYIKNTEMLKKEKEKIKQEKQRAKEKLASNKFYTIKPDELARLIKQLVNTGKSK
jgi:hypothetical protein